MAAVAGVQAQVLVRAASAALLGEGALAAALSVKGSDALVFYRRDEAEWQRRDAEDAGRLDRMEALETLLQLPVGLPVPFGSLPGPLRAAVDALPRGAAAFRDSEVTRKAVRPLAVDLVVVRSSPGSWKDGLRRAGRFAPFSRRALLVDVAPGEREDLLMEAAFYGIGVFTPAAGGVDLVVEPRAYRPRRHTAAAWRFVEELYQRLR